MTQRLSELTFGSAMWKWALLRSELTAFARRARTGESAELAASDQIATCRVFGQPVAPRADRSPCRSTSTAPKA